MDNIVYSYGGGEALFKVLMGIKMIYNSELSKDLIHMMTFVGLAWAAFQGVTQNSWIPKLSWVVKYALITSLFITPTADLTVSDSVTGYRNKVDNLPLGLVLPASVFSGIGFGITKLFDQAFSDADSNIAYYKYGQSFGAALISQSRNFKIQDSGFRENIEGFIDNCIIYDVMVGRKYSASDLRDSENIWALVSKNASSIRMFNYRDQGKTGERKLVTCKEGAAKLSQYWETDIDKLAKKYGSTIFGKYGDKIVQSMNNSNNQVLGKSFLANINVVTDLYGKNNGGLNTLKQIMMINAIADIPMSYGAVKAKQQQQEAWLISGQLAREILPTLHAIFAALIYASFILIVGMLVLPNGFKTLANYFGLLIWIETWPPLFAVLNLLTNVSSKTLGGDFSAITMNNASQIISHNNNISVVASGMMIVLPYLSYNLLKGGAGQFVHLANQVMGSSQSAAMAASNEVTSGNRSLDNTSISNGQWHNNSGFKTDMNAAFRSGHQEHQLADGTLVKQTADGNMILHSGPGITESAGADSMHMSKSNSSQDHQSLSYEKSKLKSEQFEYAKTEQETQRQAYEFVKRIAAGELSGTNYNYDKTSASGKVFHDAVAEEKQLQLYHRYAHTQTSGVGIGGKIGGEVGLGTGGGDSLVGKSPFKANVSAGIEINARGSADHTNEQSVAENRGSSTNANVADQVEDIARVAKSMHFGETQNNEKSLADSLSGSYEQMIQQRSSISVHQDNIDRYQSSQDNTQGTSYTENRDTYSDKLDYIAKKKDEDGFTIGKVSAAKIIRDRGPQYEALNQEYISKHLPPQKMLNHDFNHQKAIAEISESNLQGSYNDVRVRGAALMRSDADIDKQAKREYALQSSNNNVNIEAAEKKILNSGNDKQDQANQAEADRPDYSKDLFGINKNENEEFKK